MSGDAYSKHPGDKPWISEMYGYSFGAAKANVWHKWDPEVMMYPGYEPAGEGGGGGGEGAGGKEKESRNGWGRIGGKR